MATDSDFRTLLKDISCELSRNKLAQLKYIAKSKWEIPEEEEGLEENATGREILDCLARRQIISKDNISNLEHAFEIISGCSTLREILRQYTEKFQTIRNAKLRAMWHLLLVPNFIVTSMCKKVKECVEKHRLAILKGIEAAGKSQICYWYAADFQKKENHVTCMLRCTNKDDLINSLGGFLEFLEMRFQQEREEIGDYVMQMAEVAMSLIQTGRLENKQYLFVFDDVTEETCKIVEQIIYLFHKENNVKILCSTIYSKFYRHCTEHDVFVKIAGVSKSEALKFLKDIKMKYSEESIQALAIEMGYLSYGLVLANSYLFTTDMSLEVYIDKLSDKEFFKQVEESVSCTWQAYDKGLLSAHMLTIRKVEETSSVHVKPLLRFMPFLHHNEIPITLLKKLLSESMDERDKVTTIFELIANIRKYCIGGEIQSEHQTQAISIHAVTALVLEIRLSQEEKESTIMDLLCFFCKNMNIDCRLHLTLVSNLELEPHAAKVVLRAAKLKSSKETIFLMCALHAAIGVTFRVSGVEHLLAEDHLKKAKTLCFQLIDMTDPESLMLTIEEFETLDTMEYIDESKNVAVNPEGNEHPGRERENENRQNARMKDSKAESLFQSLENATGKLPTNLIPDIVLQAEKTPHELDHLEEVAEFYGDMKHVDERKRGRLSNELYQKLFDKKLALSREKLGEVVLVELMMIILYNVGRVHQYQSKSYPELTLVCKNEFRLAYLLGKLLDGKYKEFPSMQSLITRRSGILYHCLVSRTYGSESGEERDVILQKVICRYKEMLEERDLNFYEYGIIKLSKFQRLHHDATCLKLLLKCSNTRMALAGTKEKEESYFKDGHIYANKLEELLTHRHICRWLAVPGFHVELARFFLKHNLEKAENHFRRAVELEKDYNLQRMSRFTLKCRFGLLDCLISRNTESSLREASDLCRKLEKSLHESKFTRSYQKAVSYTTKVKEGLTKWRH